MAVSKNLWYNLKITLNANYKLNIRFSSYFLEPQKSIMSKENFNRFQERSTAPIRKARRKKLLPLQFEQRSMSTQTKDIDITQFLFGAKVHKVCIWIFKIITGREQLIWTQLIW